MTEAAGASRFTWTSVLRRVGRFLVGLPAPAAWALAIAWGLLIWSLSSQSFESLSGEGGFALRAVANLAHAPLFGILALLLATLALRSSRVPTSSSGGPRAGEWTPPPLGALRGLAVLACVVAYGLVDEWHQGSTAHRNSSMLDVVTDGVGALCVLWVIGHVTSAGASEAGLRTRLACGVAACIATSCIVTALG